MLEFRSGDDVIHAGFGLGNIVRLERRTAVGRSRDAPLLRPGVQQNDRLVPIDALDVGKLRAVTRRARNWTNIARCSRASGTARARSPQAAGQDQPTFGAGVVSRHLRSRARPERDGLVSPASAKPTRACCKKFVTTCGGNGPPPRAYPCRKPFWKWTHCYRPDATTTSCRRDRPPPRAG